MEAHPPSERSRTRQLLPATFGTDIAGATGVVIAATCPRPTAPAIRATTRRSIDHGIAQSLLTEFGMHSLTRVKDVRVDLHQWRARLSWNANEGRWYFVHFDPDQGCLSNKTA
jgi:hypothetical protein